MKSKRCDSNARGWRLEAGGNSLKPRALSLEQGFSLIELLMAAVIAASVGSLLAGGLIAMNRSRDIRVEQAISTQLLAGQLALLDDEINDQTPMAGTIPASPNDFRWTIERVEAPLVPLVTTTLVLSHNGHDTHVVTYRRIAEQ